MVNPLSPNQVWQLRFRAQRLSPESAGSDVAQIIHDLCALQSQELPSANLAVRARSNGLTIEDVKRAREIDRSIVLTWTMRGTMHLVATADVHWQFVLLGARFIRKTARRYRQLGLDEATRHNAARHMRDILSNRGPLTRAELAQALAVHGIPVEGQAIHHLVRYAALSGIICFGPEREGELTYIVLDDWLKLENTPKLTDAQMLETVARRYLLAYAPATPHDLVSWAGITVSEAKAGFEAIADDLVAVEIQSEAAWMLWQQWELIDRMGAGPTVRLLPRYDNYLLGYQGRDFMVDDDFADQVHPGGGLIRTSVIVDGQAQATWRMERRRKTSTIIVQPFATLDPALLPALEAEVQDIGRFLNQTTQLKIEDR